MSPDYRLTVIGHITVAFEDDVAIPTTQAALKALLRHHTTAASDLDNLTLWLVKVSEEERAAREAKIDRNRQANPRRIKG